MNKSFVVKLGGSLIYDMDLNVRVDVLSKFIDWYGRAVDKYDQIVIVVGGGKISRHIVDQVDSLVPADMGRHAIGMAGTNLNAEILRVVLGVDDVRIPHSLGEAVDYLVGDKKNVLVTGGFKEGWSTDMDAAVLANVIGTDRVYKLSNIDHIYTDDPNKVPDAQVLKEMTWQEYFNQFGITSGMTEQPPNIHTPIGMFSSQFCAQKGLSFFVSGGKNIDKYSTLDEVFESGSFVHP